MPFAKSNLLQTVGLKPAVKWLYIKYPNGLVLDRVRDKAGQFERPRRMK